MTQETERRETASAFSTWDRFWFTPAPIRRSVAIRTLLAVIAAFYFVSCWSDLSFWYSADGTFSPESSSKFWTTAGLSDEARWNLSPLFLSDSSWVYRTYLISGIGCAVAVACGIGGRITATLLWGLLVGWANRAMILSGLTESLLSLALFASIIAPSARLWKPQRDLDTLDWTARLATRLQAIQISLVAVLTFATMLGGRVWFNGLGAFALAAPWQDRTINWTVANSLFVSGPVHELVTHLMVLALPLGVLLAWIPPTARYGKTILVAWCVIVAALGSLWLYAATFAVMVLAIDPYRRRE